MLSPKLTTGLLGAKTPRANAPYLVTAEGFGAEGYKPPITADILFTKEMYEDCPIDSTWSHGSLEDYEWFWRVVERGHKVLVSNDLFGWHHHRAGFKKLAGEYRRSARGCAYFIRAHRDSPFAQKRMTQAVVLPLAAFAVLLGGAAATVMGHGSLAAVTVLAAAVAVVVLFCGREFARTRTLESLLYPGPALVLGINYTASLVTHLIRNAPMHAAPSTAYDLPVLGEDVPTGRRGLARLVHPLTAILALQCVLSMSMIWSNTAFNDEGDYIWIGHQVIAYWLHGAPWDSAYAHGVLSGSPFIYPPLGAAADALGGLVGARLLSLLFLIGATICLWSITRKIYGKAAAIAAASLWVTCPPAIKLGAFATYDGMSIFLMALSACLIVQAGHRKHKGEFITLAALFLGASAVTAYSGLVMVPVVIAFAFLALRIMLGTRAGAYSAGWFAVASSLSFAGLMMISHSWRGLMFTVINRQVGGATATTGHVIHDSWSYTGMIAILAAVGCLIALGRNEGSLRSITIFLAITAVVVPIAQSHDQSAFSLDKHLAYGAWFASAAAGYGCSRAVGFLRDVRMPRIYAVFCCVIALGYPIINGWDAAWHDFHSWYNADSLTTALSPIAQRTPGLIYVPNGNMFTVAYSMRSVKEWERWTYILPSPYQKTLETGKYGVIVLYYTTSLSSPSINDNLIFSARDSTIHDKLLNLIGENSRSPELASLTIALEADRGYRLVATGPFNSGQGTATYAIWERISASASKRTKQKVMKR